MVIEVKQEKKDFQESTKSNPNHRNDYFDSTVLNKIEEIFNLPIPELIYKAQYIHKENHDPRKIQFCTLSSIKTGACPEDCHYCPQSAHYKTNVQSHSLLDKESVVQQAKEAKSNGSTRFCMGASWRELPEGKEFDEIIELVKSVKELDLEVCCTLGMINSDQAKKLAEAGLHSYNHNIDTSPEYYEEIINTRTFQERIETLQNISNAGINVCSGGIIGMGESTKDRQKFLAVLSSMVPHPSSVPINALVPVEGTPLGDRPIVDPIELVRMVATARIMMPKAMVRLSAGRKFLSDEAQALCFIAGANSIHTGEKLLTTDNAGTSKDKEILNKLGMSIL
ncbi:MAG: biotin synthase BioB [Candidatus Caenarcaniphilales bacterium]|nr:biotin synthase BioB [Candidatus Caenarcaniphilales bacterium]